MFNFDKKTYIILFSILYSIGIITGCVVRSVYFCFTLTGMFSILSMWLVYFLTSNGHGNKRSARKHTKPFREIITREEIDEKIDHIIESSKNDEQEIYIGEFISEDDFKSMENERKTWFTESNKRLNSSLSDIRKMLNGED